MVAISLDVPAEQDPTDIGRDFARDLGRQYGERFGEHWVELPNPLDGIRRVRLNLPKDREASLGALWCLVAVNLWCLRRARRMRRGYPPIYRAVCYEPEPLGQEVWQSIPAMYQRGVGDCEDLTCARVAERIAVGDACRPALKPQRRPNGSILYHVVIENPDGTIEDPSKPLGMNFGADPDAAADTIPRCRRPAARKPQ